MWDINSACSRFCLLVMNIMKGRMSLQRDAEGLGGGGGAGGNARAALGEESVTRRKGPGYGYNFRTSGGGTSLSEPGACGLFFKHRGCCLTDHTLPWLLRSSPAALSCAGGRKHSQVTLTMNEAKIRIPFPLLKGRCVCQGLGTLCLPQLFLKF